MKVELNIDAANVTETVEDLFKNLPEQKKHELAGKVVKGFFDLPYGAERELQERKLIEGMRDGSLCDSYDKDRFKNASDAEIRKDYRFHDRLKNVKLPREQFLANATTEVVKLVSAATIERIQKDPEIQKIIDATVEQVKADFPKFIEKAIASWFVNNMARQLADTSMVLEASDRMTKQVEDIQKQIRGY